MAWNLIYAHLPMQNSSLILDTIITYAKIHAFKLKDVCHVY